MNKMPLWPLCCAILLTGCTGAPQTHIKVVRPEIPVSLQSCADVPDYPGEGITQRDIAANYTRLWYAHADCKSKLQSLNHALNNSTETPLE